MAKLTKRDIEKTLEEMPIDALITGKASSRELTTKQKEFAKGLALGLPKAQAYKKAYNSKGTARTNAVNGHNLAKRADIQIIAQGFREAFEAREYQKPAQIRELIVHNLLMMSLSEKVKDAQRIKSLELLGKLSDVNAWSEQKTTTVIHESSKLKQKLIDQLQTIVHGEVKEVTEDEGDLLLRELLGEGVEKGEESRPTPPPPPQKNLTTPLATTHINPHTQTSPNIVSTKSSSDSDDVTVHVDSEGGVGGFSDFDGELDVEYREGPPMEKGTPESGEGV